MVPFAALRDLIEVPDTGKTAAVLRAARESVGDGLLLIVDDAHLLDNLSATLVYQLAVGGAARLIVTVDRRRGCAAIRSRRCGSTTCCRGSSSTAPDADRTRLDASVREFVASLAGRGPHGTGVSGGGRPAAARPTCRRWPAPTRCRQAEARRRDHRRRRRWRGRRIRLRRRGSGAAAGRGPARAASRAVRTADAPGARGMSSTGCGWRCWRWTATTRSRLPTRWRPAADALRLGDLALGERLGAAVLERDPDLDARLTLAQALAWQGRGREADEVLAAVDPGDAVRYRADGVGTAPRGQSVLDAVRAGAGDRVPADHPQPRVVTGGADHARRAVGHLRDERGHVRGRALEIADEVLASPDADDTAVGWAAAAAALSSRADGPVRRRRRARRPGGGGRASRAAAVHQRVRPDDDAVDGRRAGPGSGACPAAAPISREMQQPGRAIGEVLVADVLIAAGSWPPRRSCCAARPRRWRAPGIPGVRWR